MFSVRFGSKNREERIRQIAQEDHTLAVVLAAVHFEWMLKRAVLKLGRGPTKALRDMLADVYTIDDKSHGKEGYKSIWHRQVEPRFKNAALGTVLGRLAAIQSKALKTRGRIVHGNGTVSRTQADEAVPLFLAAGEKLRVFAERNGEDLDSRLKLRMKARNLS